MGRKRVLSKNVVLALLVVPWVLAACGPGSTPTASPTPTIPAEPPSIGEPGPTPALPPLQAPGWEDVTVHTLCLEVEQYYPEIEGEFSQPIGETIHHILSGLALDVVAGEDHCDATLSITIIGEALGANYWGGGYCYTGAEVSGELTLSIAGRAPLTLPVDGGYPPPQYIGYCPEGPGEAPLGRVWSEALLDDLVQLWGLPPLIQALGDEEYYVRRAAAQALAEVGPEAIEAVPALIQALEDEDYRVREAAAQALAKVGPEAVEVVPALIHALGDEDHRVRETAAEALGEMGREAVPALILALGDENANVRDAAAQALRDIGPEAAAAIPALIHALRDNSVSVRASAASALRAVGPEAVEAVPALIQALGDESESVRSQAARALGEIGSDAREAVPALIQLLRDETGYLRAYATKALEAITGQDFGGDAEAWQEWWESQQ